MSLDRSSSPFWGVRPVSDQSLFPVDFKQSCLHSRLSAVKWGIR